MSFTEPDFTIGVEEEYLLVDLDSLDLAPAPEALMQECSNRLQGQFAPEYLNCQIEIGSRVCRTIGEARKDLHRLRSTVAEEAAKHNLAPIASSCHPFSDWRDQHQTDKERYNALRNDLGGGCAAHANMWPACTRWHTGCRSAHRPYEPGTLLPSTPARIELLIALLARGRYWISLLSLDCI